MNSPPRADMAAVSIAQIGLCTDDLPASLRMYSELFGLDNAGGNAIWGNVITIQNLPPESQGLIWWMVDKAPFFQWEFFYHTTPKQRPLAADWRPSDHGWVRYGIAVPDFDRVVAGLDRLHIAVIGQKGASGQRRLAFRDPHIGAIVEVIEKPGSVGPLFVYAANSVADIEASRRFYGEVIGGKIEPLETLHQPEDEALWGLPDAKRKGFVVRFGDRCFEIIEYTTPKGRPRRPDHRVSDQGVMNMALGSRDLPPISALVKRIIAAGATVTIGKDSPEPAGTYVLDPGCELEIMSIPEALYPALGFEPTFPFLDVFVSQHFDVS